VPRDPFHSWWWVLGRWVLCPVIIIWRPSLHH
jgi:hypothetical protein